MYIIFKITFLGSGDGDLGILGTHQFTAKSKESVTFKVTRGDYAPLMKLLVDNLLKAKVNQFINFTLYQEVYTGDETDV